MIFVNVGRPNMHFNRRALLKAATTSLAYPWLAHAIPNSRLRPKHRAWRRRESILGKRRVPIIDLQATYAAKLTNLNKVMAYMDELDIAQTAFAVAGEQDGALSVELHRKYPEYFIPTTSSGEFPRWWNSPDAFLDVSRAELQTGDFFSMGEHEFRHYPSPEQVASGRLDRDITVPIDSSIGDKLFAMSAEFQVPFQIHYEIEDALLPALETMLDRHPRRWSSGAIWGWYAIPTKTPATHRLTSARSLRAFRDCILIWRFQAPKVFTHPPARAMPRFSSPAARSSTHGTRCWNNTPIASWWRLTTGHR
jgi:hypothetical protein